MTIELSEGARASLDAICDTFVPGENGLPSATDLHVPDVILGAMGANPSADVRDGFAGLIEGWDSGFASLPREERERALLDWCDSDDLMQRAAFQALRKLTMVMYYTVPWQGEGKNPIDEAIGYPGPHGKLADAPKKTIEPLAITEDTELDCDVVVVGSGAGGGVAAAVLAQAGLDVVVVEAGGYFSEEDFDGAETDTCGSTSAAAVCPRPTRAWACSPASASAGAPRSTTPGASARRTTFAMTGGIALGSRTGWGRISTTASTRSGIASTSTPRTACPHSATSASARASPSSAGTPR